MIAVEDITEYCWVISFTPINSRIVLIILQNESIFRWAATAVGREVIIACHSGIFEIRYKLWLGFFVSTFALRSTIR